MVPDMLIVSLLDKDDEEAHELCSSAEGRVSNWYLTEVVGSTHEFAAVVNIMGRMGRVVFCKHAAEHPESRLLRQVAKFYGIEVG